jgi:hypothetical protein
MGLVALLAQAEQPTKVKEADLYVSLLQYWSSRFSGMSVISNQECLIHRDVQARKPWYEILATFGDYTYGRMELPSLVLWLEYDPGTVIGLTGRVVPHGVANSTGNRVCLAYYMRDSVHERAGVSSRVDGCNYVYVLMIIVHQNNQLMLSGSVNSYHWDLCCVQSDLWVTSKSLLYRPHG